MLVVGRVGALAIAFSSVIACGPARIIDQSGTDTGSSGGDDGASSSSSSSSGGGSSGGSSGGGSSSSSSGDTGDETSTDDWPPWETGDDWPPDIECDVWAQDCPNYDEKCMPWANDGTSVWNATKCVPLDPDPRPPGDICQVEGAAWSGVDNCDATSMCWDVDPDTLEGMCVPFCTGTEESPMCDHPSLRCNICNDGVLILCLPPDCDPLVQDCPDGEGCYVSQWGTMCDLDASAPGAGGAGDPCGYVNACDPGLLCVIAEWVPGCVDGPGCCAPFCDVNAPNCNVDAGEECVPAWDEGEAPLCPNLEHVGICRLPL